jgi:hypothetical protein
MAQGYRVEWHPGDGAPFLGVEEIVRRVTKRRKELFLARPVKLEVLLKEVAAGAGLKPGGLLGRGRSARIVEARRSLVRKAVLEEGHRVSEVATFLGCHASNVSRALQGSWEEN